LAVCLYRGLCAFIKNIMKYEEGQTVEYAGKQTHIETIFEDGTCNIANPFWDWDEEGEYVRNDEEYDVPYWLTVKLSELNCA